MPWVDVAEQNPWASSEDEASESPLLISSGPVVVDKAPTIKKEPPSVVVLEILSSSPSPILKGEDNEGQHDVPELPGTHLTAPVTVPGGRAMSSHPSPSNSDTQTARPTAPTGPSLVNGEGAPCKEESHHETPSHAHTTQAFTVRNSSSPVAVSDTKRHSSSESLSPALTEDVDIDDEEEEDEDDVSPS